MIARINPLISVILPIYNVEDFLVQCLDSVISQSYRDLEIILVNDGSTDTSSQICDGYAEKDKRIKVIHKKNGGLSDARNYGMNCATGELISFVDSDDLLSPYFFQKLLHALTEQDADIAECEFKKFVNDDEIENLHNNTENRIQVFEGENTIEALFKGPLHVMVWNKIYKIELVRNKIFPVDSISEDVFWTYKIYGESTKTVKIDEQLYFYRQRENSIMGANYSLKRLDKIRAWEEMITFMEKKYPTFVKDLNKGYCFLLIENYIQLKLHNEVDPHMSHRHTLLEKIKKYNQWAELKNWNWKNIIWYQLFLCSPSAYESLRNYMDKKSAKRQNTKK